MNPVKSEILFAESLCGAPIVKHELVKLFKRTRILKISTLATMCQMKSYAKFWPHKNLIFRFMFQPPQGKLYQIKIQIVQNDPSHLASTSASN